MNLQNLEPLVSFYETLTAENVGRLDRFYSADAVFKDPFNEVCGLKAITRIFRHMFIQVDAPRFLFTGRFFGEAGVMLLWEFHFRTRRAPLQTLCVRGSTHLRFDDDGKVILHRDYWDAAEELYAKLPVLGWLMRRLQRMSRA